MKKPPWTWVREHPMERRNVPTTVDLPSGWQRRAARDSEDRKLLVVAEYSSEVTPMAVSFESLVSVFVMARPYSGHPISKASAKDFSVLVRQSLGSYGSGEKTVNITNGS